MHINHIIYIFVVNKLHIMSTDYTEEEQNAMRMKAALQAGEELPADVFSAVPDEDIVTLEVSGQFGRILNRVLEYLYQCEHEAIVVESAQSVANNFEGLKQDQISQHAIALWCVSNLLANFSMNAGTQNKTKIYDREKIMTHIFGGVRNPEPLVPLTPEEFEERKEAHAKKLKEDPSLAEKSRTDQVITHTDDTVKKVKEIRNTPAIRKTIKTSDQNKNIRSEEEKAERKKEKLVERLAREKEEKKNPNHPNYEG